MIGGSFLSINFILTFAVLQVNLTPLKVGNLPPSTCSDIPEQSGSLLGIQEQSFKANLTTNVYYCRKIFVGKRQAFEIVHQKISDSSDYPDLIEVTDCKTYHYALTIDHNCHFQFSRKPTDEIPNCVTYCEKNRICPSEAQLCSVAVQFRQFYPEQDFNEKNDVLYNFNNTLRAHCDITLLNELPMPEAKCP